MRYTTRQLRGILAKNCNLLVINLIRQQVKCYRTGSRYFVPQYFNQPVARILRLNLPSDQRSQNGIAIVKTCINYVVKPSALEILSEHNRKVLTGGISLNIMLVTFSDV